MHASLRRRPVLVLAAAALLIALVAPSAALGHAALTASNPADKGSVAGPFAGPITLTFSEALQSGSHAELLSGSTKVADATVSGATMTFAPSPALAPGAYTVQWTSVAADKDVARGTISFTVTQPTPAPATPTPAPTAAPTAAPTVAATATTAPTASPAATPAPTAAASASPAGGSAATGGADALLPVVVALVFVGLVAASLLRRRAGS